MNCVPGCLAMLVRGNERGMAVTCIRLEDPPIPAGYRIAMPGRIWRVDRPVTWIRGNGELAGTEFQQPFAPDDYLVRLDPPPTDQDIEDARELFWSIPWGAHA